MEKQRRVRRTRTPASPRSRDAARPARFLPRLRLVVDHLEGLALVLASLRVRRLLELRLQLHRLRLLLRGLARDEGSGAGAPDVRGRLLPRRARARAHAVVRDGRGRRSGVGDLPRERPPPAVRDVLQHLLLVARRGIVARGRAPARRRRHGRFRRRRADASRANRSMPSNAPPSMPRTLGAFLPRRGAPSSLAPRSAARGRARGVL